MYIYPTPIFIGPKGKLKDGRKYLQPLQFNKFEFETNTKSA